MSEPVTLYKGTESVTVVAPSEAQRLIAEGWTHVKGQRQEGQDAQGRKEGQEIEGERQAVEPDPQFAPKQHAPDSQFVKLSKPSKK